MTGYHLVCFSDMVAIGNLREEDFCLMIFDIVKTLFIFEGLMNQLVGLFIFYIFLWRIIIIRFPANDLTGHLLETAF